MKIVDKSAGIWHKTADAHTAPIPPLDRGRGRHGRLSHGRAVLGVVLLLAFGSSALAEENVALRDGWQLQSSAQAGGAGAAISDPTFKAAGWTTVTVPNTIVGALVGAKAPGYDFDPYWGMNLRKLPGTTYPIARNYSHFEMVPDSPFAKSWWYRKTFDLPAGFRGRTVWIRFDGLNYRANVWMNGKPVADKTQAVGTFRTHEWNVTAHVRDGANALAVEIFAPGKTDMALTWVDWNPMPPDRNAGLYQPVSIAASGPVALRFPHVVSRVAPSLDSARLAVTVEAVNATDKEQEAQVKGAIEGVTFERKVTLRPGETRQVEFDTDTFPQLVVKSPRLWWPYLLGKAEMYEMQTEAHVGGELSDRQTTRFGIREVTQEMTPGGSQQVRVNGRPVLVRGGGWASDMMLRQDPARLEIEMRYVKEMNLNTVRLEGKPESDAFYEIADREGILLITGWCCCDQWEDWKKWSGENRWVAVDSLRDQIKRLRNHPSVIMWSLANEPHSRRPEAKAFFRTLYDLAKALDATRPVTVVSHVGVAEESFEFLDVLCLNRYYGWYTQSGQLDVALPLLSEELDALHARFHKPLIVTEFGADTIPGHHAQPPEMFSEEFQAELLTRYMELFKTKPYIVGEHIWNLCDFKTSQSPIRMGGLNMKGIFTRDRRPKQAARVLRALWK